MVNNRAVASALPGNQFGYGVSLRLVSVTY